jgi:hypothetical protein
MAGNIHVTTLRNTKASIIQENKTWWTQLPMFYLLVVDYDRALQTLDLAYKQDYLDKE